MNCIVGGSVMRLYRYRRIARALEEIDNGTIYFPTREELNDPVEGYVRVFWQGDKFAWEGLFKNYIYSLMKAIQLYLIASDEELLHKNSINKDIYDYRNTPIVKVFEKLGTALLEESDIIRIAEFYGNKNLKCTAEELKIILRLIHDKALMLCIESCLKEKIIPEAEGRNILNSIQKKVINSIPIEQLTYLNDEKRMEFMHYLESSFEDLIELQYIQMGLKNNSFLYGSQSKDSNGNDTRINTEDKQYRNWLAVSVDFPEIYVEQLKNMIYPEGFFVCFSKHNDNTAMWGNYAESHTGVCFIYETDENNSFHFKFPNDNKVDFIPKKTDYEGKLIERNFFETLGGLTLPQIIRWLTGKGEISNCYKTITADMDAWRKNYWEAFEVKNYQKLKHWSYEEEYRIDITNEFHDLSDKNSRFLEYDPQNVKGVIFGIRTTEYDKKRIFELLKKKKDSFKDFTFYQAEYDETEQKIKVREKHPWKL